MAFIRLHIEEALAIQRHRPQLNRRDEDLGTGSLHKIFNHQTTKASYSCMQNIAQIIKSHNQRASYIV